MRGGPGCSPIGIVVAGFLQTVDECELVSTQLSMDRLHAIIDTSHVSAWVKWLFTYQGNLVYSCTEIHGCSVSLSFHTETSILSLQTPWLDNNNVLGYV